MYLAGAFMIVLGLGMTGKVPWAARLTPRPPKALMNALMKLRRKASSDADAGESTLMTPVFFGLITGLLPCGPLMAAQVSAAASGSAVAGSLGMAAFAVGTAPLMVAFGTAGSLIPKRFKERMMVALAVGVVIFGLVFINRALMLTGAPVNFNTVKMAVLGGPTVDTSQFTEGEDGVVEVPLVIENVKFVPQTLAIPADKPVRLIVDRREANACSDELALPQLGIQVPLAPNAITTVDIPATAAGNYTLTCQMGMMAGQLSVGGGAARGSSPVPWLLLAMAAAGGALYVSRKSPTQSAEKTAGNGQHRKGTSPAPSADRRPQQKRGAPQPAPGGMFGFRPSEVVLIVAAVGIAVMAGLAAGGMFA
jgi:hypothetical protein